MTVEQFLSTCNPKVEAMCIQLRKTARELLPDTEEILFEGWKNISYGTGAGRGAKDLLIYIIPLKDSVNLGFYHGANLPDRKKLLKGTGKLMRHVKIRSLDDLEMDDLNDLIHQAKMERLGTV